VNGVAGVRRVRSGSSPGISLVWVEFDWDTDAGIARQRVTERLQGIAAALPAEVSAPVLAPASSVMGEIAFVALTSQSVDARELRRVAETEVRRRLLGVEGIAQVVAIGGEEKQLQVIVDPQRLELHGLTQEDVSEALRRGSQNVPGGFVVDRGQEAVVRVLGRAAAPSELEAIVVGMREGGAVRVRDVADVRVGSAVARGAASYDARPAVMLSGEWMRLWPACGQCCARAVSSSAPTSFASRTSSFARSTICWRCCATARSWWCWCCLLSCGASDRP
jgi:Cu/Ag efflux pump CusA